jgi:hypothetical protein
VWASGYPSETEAIGPGENLRDHSPTRKRHPQSGSNNSVMYTCNSAMGLPDREIGEFHSLINDVKYDRLYAVSLQ